MCKRGPHITLYFILGVRIACIPTGRACAFQLAEAWRLLGSACLQVACLTKCKRGSHITLYFILGVRIVENHSCLFHPGLSWDSTFRPENSKRIRPDQFRPTFGPWPKMPKAKKPTFAL